MWSVLCLITVVLVFSFVERGPRAGAASLKAYADSVKINILVNDKRSPHHVPFYTRRIACLPCSCGVLGRKSGKIIGGSPTYIRQYPWMVMLMKDGFFQCGASLINNKYVMTAAHCVQGVEPQTLVVRLLEHDRSTNTETKHVDFKVLKATIHDEYENETFDNDIALLRMDTEGVDFGVVSTTILTGPAHYPGVYTRVNRYLDWVAKNTVDACPCSDRYEPPSGE